MGIYKSMAGLVALSLTSADMPGALRTLSERGIPLFEVRPCDELTTDFWVYRSDYGTVARIARRRGEKLHITGRRGLYWTGKTLLRRPLLLGGMLLLTVLVLYVPSRVFFVEVEGNVTVPKQLVLEAARECGISFGASRRAVRSERMKNALLRAVPQLQWAGVNTYGCRAVISVRERAKEPPAQVQNGVGSIIADRDGVVVSCTVTRGSAACAPGQAVQRGQVLISGYTDCGICVTATRASGEVFAQTRRPLTSLTPDFYRMRGVETERSENFSLLVGKKRIKFLKGSGISDATCVKMYTEYYLTLPGGFRLPLALIRETVIFCETELSDIPASEAQQLLSKAAASYLTDRMIGGTIDLSREAMQSVPGAYRLTGAYACTEMIGRVHNEKVGEYHGKTN